MAGKQIINSQHARNKILEGILEAGNTTAKTFGPRGRTVAYDRGGSFIVTKDGITVLKNIGFTDEMKNFGVMLLREASAKSNYQAGDGSTGVAILTAELCKEANKLLNRGLDINDIKEGFKLGRDFVLKHLQNYIHNIEDNKDIFNIAKISANNDEEIAKYITEAFTSIGDNGIVSIGVSQSRKGETVVKINTGIEFDRGFLSSKCVNSINDQCILQNPKILLSSKQLNDIDELQPIIEFCKLHKHPLIIIAPNFDETVMALFTELLSRKTIDCSLILAPGSTKTNIEDKLSDLSVLLNTKILGQDFDLNEFNSDKHFGTCSEIIISKGKTIIVEPKYDEAEYNKWIQFLQDKIKLDSAEKAYSEFEIESIKERIARMTGGIATILVGALTDIELNEKKDRYEDAINAVRSTINNGYVIGASTPLLKISSLEFKDEYLPPIMMAVSSYLKCMKTPAKLLISSTGKDPDVLIPKILSEKQNYGFNAKTEKIVDLIQEGIIDPYKVIYNSILYSTNIAEQFISIDAIIISDVKNLSYQSLDEVLNEEGIQWTK